jgi:predicted permease
MLKNYLTTAFRNILRQKTTSAINVGGLLLGITCSLVLFLLIQHVTSYDTYHINRDRIYRVVHESDGNQGKNNTPGVPSVLPDAFRLDFPEAEEVVFTSYRAGSLVTIPQESGDPKRYTEEAGVVFSQSNFFRIFDRDIVAGDKDHGLDDPNEAIISQRWAQKYFGKSDVLGEVVEFDDRDYKITAVMEDFPTNTDFPFDLMLSYSTIKEKTEENGWHSIWSDEQCYFLLKQGESIEKVEARMSAFTDKYVGDDNPNNAKFLVQPLREIHFDDRYGTYSYSTVSRGFILAFGVIAFILILTACINFINLSTAEAIKRSREVGIRKALGSTRQQLIRQFLGETFLITLVSMIASLGVTQLVLSLLNPFLDIELSLQLMGNPVLWVFLVGTLITISLLSGMYPAFVVSGYHPALALKNLINNRSVSGYNLRRALVISQFFISQFFIIGTIVVMKQLEYFQNTSLGFRQDAIVIVPIPQRESPEGADGMSKMRTVREEILRIPGIGNASLNSAPPSSGRVSGTHFKVEGSDEDFGTQIKQVDGRYVDLFDLELVAGQNIKDLDTADGFLVNEKFVKTIGLHDPGEIIGRQVNIWGKQYPVVGVVRDFHTVSLREPIEATLMMNRIRGFESLALQVNPAQVQESLDRVKDVWQNAYPEHLFTYEFLDQQIREFYETEQKMSVLFGIFSSIAMFIGCLGLFGLATFLSNQKTKEVGVRKVLGASVESIIFLFSKEYIKLILVGFAFSAPLGWFAMNTYLDTFAYKIPIGVGVFVVGLVVTMAIALLTVGYKSLRSAMVNPTVALRSE